MKLKKVFILPLIALSMCTLSACGNNDSGDDDYGITQDTYYGVEKGDFGSELQLKLHEHLLAKHKNYILYSDFNDYVSGKKGVELIDPNDKTKGYKSIDADPANPEKKVIWFYTGKSAVRSITASREHVWACAQSSGLWVHDGTPGILVDEKGYKGGGSDLFHVRPCQNTVNNVRGDAKIYEFKEDDDYYETGDGGPYKLKSDEKVEFSKKYEPDDHFKGDIARILMYVYIHYGPMGTHNDYTGNLALTNVFHSSYNFNEVYKLMVKWNNLDPVDDYERNRNDVVEKIQGNRNPFIDHPEYMAACFAIED